jgi:hypothetical protein
MPEKFNCVVETKNKNAGHIDEIPCPVYNTHLTIRYVVSWQPVNKGHRFIGVDLLTSRHLQQQKFSVTAHVTNRNCVPNTAPGWNENHI